MTESESAGSLRFSEVCARYGNRPILGLCPASGYSTGIVGDEDYSASHARCVLMAAMRPLTLECLTKATGSTDSATTLYL